MSAPSNDVLVFVHIQKTAGTSFERFLVRYLSVSRPCACNMRRKRCECLRPSALSMKNRGGDDDDANAVLAARNTTTNVGGNNDGIWLFSRYSTGWACGLHADFTEMYVSGCVERVLDRKEGEFLRASKLLINFWLRKY